jgi:GH15 family glucan-1,4-alpha-glucosidase
MSKYPRIADDGLAMNLETAALVATDSTIDRRCAPRFDSASVSGGVLHHDRGGPFRAVGRQCKATSTHLVS